MGGLRTLNRTPLTFYLITGAPNKRLQLTAFGARDRAFFEAV